MNVLVACEESQAVCLAFRRLGHKAFSCDLQECSGGHPEYHFKGDMFDVIANRGGTLENGTKHFLDSCWDLVIAHPPCTYLAVSGARWYYHLSLIHISEPTRRTPISYAVFCLKKKNTSQRLFYPHFGSTLQW